MTKTLTRTRQPAGLRALSMRQTLPRTQPAFASHRAGPCSPPRSREDTRTGAGGGATAGLPVPTSLHPRPSPLHHAGPFAMLVSGGGPVTRPAPYAYASRPAGLPVPRSHRRYRVFNTLAHPTWPSIEHRGRALRGREAPKPRQDQDQVTRSSFGFGGDATPSRNRRIGRTIATYASLANNPLKLSPQKPGRAGTPGQLRRETTPRLRYAQTPTGPYPTANQPPETTP